MEHEAGLAPLALPTGQRRTTEQLRALSPTKARQASLPTSPEDLPLVVPPTPGDPGEAGPRACLAKLRHQDRPQQRQESGLF
jgi:hypothetical protein